MKMTVKVEGLKDLEKSLEELGKRTGRTVMHRSLRRAALPMRDLARDYAPHDTGNLEESIEISTKADGAEAGQSEFRETLRNGGTRGEAVAALRQARRALSGSVSLYIGPTKKWAFVGRFQEFGTAHHPADPFMRPAFDKEARPTIERLKPILGDEIRKAAARAARRAAKRTGGAS